MIVSIYPTALARRLALFVLFFGSPLWAIDEGDIARWISDLDSPDRQVRLEAINRLGDLESDGAQALIKLLQLSRSDAKSDRVNSVWALAKIAPRDPRVINAMASALESGEYEVAYNASLGLQWAGEAAAPALIDVFESGRDPWGVFYAVFTLSKWDGAYVERAKSVYVDMIGSRDALKARAALEALGQIADQLSIGEELKDVLEASLKSSESSVRTAAAYALMKFEKSAIEFESSLIEAVRSESSRDPKLAAIEALGAISKSEAVMEVLNETLYSDDARTRHWAAQAFRGFGEEAIPGLKQVIASDSFDARMSAFDAVAQLDAPNSPFIDELLTLYEQENIDARIRILYCLSALGGTREDIGAFLRKEASSSESDVVKAHARAIVGSGN